jgi:hypothetical protein
VNVWPRGTTLERSVLHPLLEGPVAPPRVKRKAFTSWQPIVDDQLPQSSCEGWCNATVLRSHTIFQYIPNRPYTPCLI